MDILRQELGAKYQTTKSLSPSSKQNQLSCTKHVNENQIARAADFAVVAGFTARFGQSKQWQGREVEIYNLYG